MKDRLLTIVLSVAATMGIMKAEPERFKELEVDRLIVRDELIVSDTGKIWEEGYDCVGFLKKNKRRIRLKC